MKVQYLKTDEVLKSTENS